MGKQVERERRNPLWILPDTPRVEPFLFRRRLEEELIKSLLVLPNEWVESVRNREDDMEIGDRQ